MDPDQPRPVLGSSGDGPRGVDGLHTADLEFAQRHVAHGESMVLHQQSIIDDSGTDGADRRIAKAWLEVFRSGLAKHIAERDRIAEELATHFP